MNSRTAALLALLACAIGLASLPGRAAAAPPAGATPHYYYDRETAFVISRAIDPQQGGMFVAVGADGAPIPGALPVEVWGFPAGSVRGVSKSHIGQGTCVRYFVNEYLRATVSGAGVAGINAQLPPGAAPLAGPLDLLGYARSCADFVARHLEVPPADAAPEPPNASGVYPPGADQGDVAIPNRLFYWGFSGRDGAGEFIDDTFPNGGRSPARSESSIPWSIAELALALKRAGQPQAEWQPYADAALRWWTWRRASAGALPPYGDPSRPIGGDGCGGQPDNPDGCIPGIGRDVYYPALGYALAELLESPVYREGDGSAMADGLPYGARPFATRFLGAGAAPAMPFPPTNGLQDNAYQAGFGRAVAYAWEAQRLAGPPAARGRYWDFGTNPALDTAGGATRIRPLSDGLFSAGNLGIPFRHFAGREIVSGTQRVHWLHATFGINPAAPYASPALAQADHLRAAFDFWTFANAQFWDDTPGQQAWFEAVGQPYKPCFAGGTEVPLGDWLAPEIASKTHSPEIPSPAQDVTVTVGGVRDPSWPYLSMQLVGSGVAAVDVRYSTDGGATWTTVAAGAAGAAGTYTARIPAQPLGTTVLYYARARDLFGNWAAYPAGAETWDSAGVSAVAPAAAQRYQVVPPTAIALAEFTAAREDGGVAVRWRTSAEVGTWGFHLLRSATGRRTDAERVTAELIAAQGRGSGGASYEWRDAGAAPGATYSYWLEEHELGGATNEYGPADTAPRPFEASAWLYAPLVSR